MSRRLGGTVSKHGLLILATLIALFPVYVMISAAFKTQASFLAHPWAPIAEPTLSGFLDNITLSDRDSESDKDEQLKQRGVRLMTIHSAKGLEFPRVYLVGMEEGLLPHRRSVDAEGESPEAIDEERRQRR